MSRKWMILVIIICIYLPVAIDATVLHVAVPTLSLQLSLNQSQMLWVMDIYSLVLAGCILVMGAWGDRIGFKRLMNSGAIIFGLASLLAASAQTAAQLIAARALLGLGAAMILPATLAALRHYFVVPAQRNFALGIWGVVGGGGAAFGPLIGGLLLEYFEWGAVFLMNIPLVILVLILSLCLIPKQTTTASQPLHIPQALTLIAAILLLIYALKAAMQHWSVDVLGIMALGLALLFYFIRQQLTQAQPMLDLRLFKQPVLSISVLMVIISMMALVGFELLISQELQWVYGLSALEAGQYILPYMLAISCGGPLASALMNRYALRSIASLGMLSCAVSFYALAMTDLLHQAWQAWAWMLLLGISVEIALLSATAAILAALPQHQANAAGAIEGMAYELGAGFGIGVFGVLLSVFYSHAMVLPQGLPADLAEMAQHSMTEAQQLAQQLSPSLMQQVNAAAASAFHYSHVQVLSIASGLLLLLSVLIWWVLAQHKQPHHRV
jgi:DHA2 family multidrug resistance protein-like MFS transporter